MVNTNELRVVEKYEAEGWKTVRGGAPDFLFLRVEDGEIEDAVFVEVKSEGSRLTYEQSVYRRVLEGLGAKFRVEVVKRCLPPPHPSPFQPPHATPFRSKPPRATPGRPKPAQATPNQFKGGEIA